MQGQGDAEAGEDQGGGVGDRGFQGGDGGEVAGGSTIRYWAVKLTATAAAARTHRLAAALRSHRPDRSGAGREAGGVPVSRAVARDGSVRARGKTGARAREPVVRCVPRRPAPVVASRARDRARWREQQAQTSWPDGAICGDERISVSCGEDAPEGQDAVTTRQDGSGFVGRPR